MMKTFTLWILSLILCLNFLHSQIYQQDYALYNAEIPTNDLCSQAKEVAIGTKLEQLHNAKATTTTEETPMRIPVTCIQSFENDVWFKFTSVPNYEHYKIIINPIYCDTPTGLQALLIKTDDCNAQNFDYVDCINPQEEQELRMFLHEPNAGVNYFIYVDGYDGTQCGFTLELLGETEEKKTLKDFKRQEVDYYRDKELTPYSPLDVNISFRNNETNIEWEDDVQSDAMLFQVQRYMEFGSYRYGRVIMSVEAQKMVDVGKAIYGVIDNGRFEEGKSYCYRIVKITSDGKKSYSEPICVEAKLLKDLFISVIVPQNEPGQYMFKYINKKRQDLVFRVLNTDYEELKSLEKKKEPKGESNVTIDMSTYPPGEYFLEGQCKEGSFLRKFVVE